MKVALSFLCALLPLLLAGCGGGGTALSVWERFEATLDVPVTGDNPFDSAQADLTGEFVSPSGETYSVSGFASRDYERELVDGTEKLTPAGDLRWTLRFTPTEAGEWRWRWSMTTPAGTQAGDWQSFDVSAAKHDRHGFLRVSPDDSRYLRFDDGAPYFAVGENLAWYDQRGTFAYDDWLSKLAAQGVNYVRLWMPSWAFGLEWTDPNTLGNYAERLDRAWQLDYVLEQAERHGIYVMLSIQNHGAFSLATNSEWDGSPYNAANGGPLARPVEFFTNDEAKTLFKRRLRYIVARWGYSPSVLAWELWNEVDNTELPETDAVVAWHQEMAQELRALDPYAHLIAPASSGRRRSSAGRTRSTSTSRRSSSGSCRRSTSRRPTCTPSAARRSTSPRCCPGSANACAGSASRRSSPRRGSTSAARPRRSTSTPRATASTTCSGPVSSPRRSAPACRGGGTT